MRPSPMARRDGEPTNPLVSSTWRVGLVERIKIALFGPV